MTKVSDNRLFIHPSLGYSYDKKVIERSQKGTKQSNVNLFAEILVVYGIDLCRPRFRGN